MKQSSIHEFCALPATERMRVVQHFITDHLRSPNTTWGFAIFRTVYTPESDSNWDALLEKLNAYVRFEVRYDFEKGLDPEPNDVVAESFKNLIFDDRGKYDGMELDAGIIDRVCLVIDEEIFNALRDAPDPAEDLSGASIKVIDRVNDAEDSHPHYEGWVTAGVGGLWRVYQIMMTSIGLGTRCEKGNDGMLYFE
ncbi:uncharacterized protein PAC_04188 [Phialocephala subalpina]|uniref:Uncharacterized protein n=1 Tax=Phialocephala subalpina TaxID=576137 RepID=A0A1L7WNF7_9HELO|nr:uncharacterized protein PAC_04188 [Phialocephala subalpina]